MKVVQNNVWAKTVTIGRNYALDFCCDQFQFHMILKYETSCHFARNDCGQAGK